MGSRAMTSKDELAPRKGLVYIPLPKEATPVVAAVTVTKKTKWFKRKYQVLHLITKDGIYEYN